MHCDIIMNRHCLKGKEKNIIAAIPPSTALIKLISYFDNYEIYMIISYL